jgi:hypothetical protein
MALGFARHVVDSIVPRFDVKSGSATAFVDVAPKTILAQFKVRSIPSPGGECITADAIVPKATGATSYDLTVTNIDPAKSTNAPTYHKVFSGSTSTGSILDIYDGGTFFGVPMEGGCATTPQGINGRKQLYADAYKNAIFTVKTTP